MVTEGAIDGNGSKLMKKDENTGCPSIPVLIRTQGNITVKLARLVSLKTVPDIKRWIRVGIVFSCPGQLNN